MNSQAYMHFSSRSNSGLNGLRVLLPMLFVVILGGCTNQNDNATTDNQVLQVKGYFEGWTFFDKANTCAEDLLTKPRISQFSVDPAAYLAFRAGLADSFDPRMPALGATENIPGCEVGDTKMLLLVECKAGWESMAVLEHDVVTMGGGFARLDKASQQLMREMLPEDIALGLMPIISPKMMVLVRNWLKMHDFAEVVAGSEMAIEKDIMEARQIVLEMGDNELLLEFDKLVNSSKGD